MSGSADFLLELLSEEIPARMQARARNDLARMFAEELNKAGLQADAIETFATPRRLALIARGLPLATAAVSEEIKGPRSSAPPQALDGFLRKTGLAREQLVERDGVFFAVIEREGQATAAVLGPAIERIVRGFPWPKSMRWGAASSSTASLRWVRPLHGIVALLGDGIVPVDVDGVVSGATTVGHRFHHPGPITLGGASDYAEKLRACHVIIDQDERAAIIRDGAQALAADAGLELVEDEGLVAENAGLTEWPVPLLGRFDADYLDVPPEVIQLTARTNQKYFVLRGSDGALANAFICTANIVANDGGAAIVAGNERVLAARLSDARFFWEQDLKVPLEELSRRLDRVKYFGGLGTYAEKQHRLEFLLDNLLTLLPKSQSPNLFGLSKLAKVDLVSSTVAEFPELQGVIGSYLVARDQYAAPHAASLKGLYHTASQIASGDPDLATNLMQLADRLDTVTSFAAVDIWFTGSRDPYAIRQAAQAAIAAILKSSIRLSLTRLIGASYSSLLSGFAMNRTVCTVEVLKGRTGETREIITPVFGAGLPDEDTRDVAPYGDQIFMAKPATRLELQATSHSEWAIENVLKFYADDIPRIESFDTVRNKVLELLIERLKVQQRDAGVRHDLIDAVFALGGEDDLVRVLALVQALQAFVETSDGTNLLAGYKRAANILKKEEGSWTPDQVRDDGDVPAEEAALVAALDGAEPTAAKAIAAEDFGAAMSALASLRQPIDNFFDKVTVNDPDPAVRARRLNLLARFRDAVHRVADFSKIEG